MLFKWPYFCLCSTLEDKWTNRENKLATLYLDSRASRPSTLGPSLPIWNRILISTRKYGCLWKPILSPHNDNNFVTYIRNDISGPLHVLWQFFFGCWVTWSISSCQKYYKSVFFPKVEWWVAELLFLSLNQCWTEGGRSTAVAEDLRPTATATVAEVWGHFYGRRSYL